MIQCRVHGVVDGRSKIKAMCGHVGVGSNKCHFGGECEHKIKTDPCANELRLEVANKQRMKKTREKWKQFADDLSDIPDWSVKSQHNGVTIGEEIRFVQATYHRLSISYSLKVGTAWAFGENNFIVIYRGKMIKVPYERNIDDLREL